MSPEIVYQQSHGFAVDVWCLGILLYEMLHGTPPFKAENLKQIKSEFRNKKLKIKPSVDADVVDLIKKLLNFDSKVRINVDEMLQHRAFSKNMRHIRRPITQEEYRLLVKYYYMNSGGTNLDTHNNEYVKQLKRESALTKTPVRSKKSFSENRIIVKTPFQNEIRQPAGVAAKKEELGKFQVEPSSKKNNFEPKKFQSPVSNLGSSQPVRGNDFRPKKFMTLHKIPLDAKSNTSRAKKDDIKFYNPPNFAGGAIGNGMSNFRKKPQPEIQKEPVKNENRSKKKFSGLKQKLQLKDRIKKEKSLKKNNPRSKHKEANESRKVTLTQLRNQAKNKLQLNASKTKPVNRPLQSRSLSLQKLINSSLISHQSSNYNSRGKVNMTNSTQSKMTLSQFQSQYSSYSGSMGNSRTVRHNRFESRAQTDKQASENKSRAMKRDTSQSIEQSMNVRVIKASVSLPKHKFAKPNQFKKTNLKMLKDNLQAAGRQNQAQRLEKLFKSFKPKSPAKDKNLKNFSSINYKIDEVIPEELYLSQFQTVKKPGEQFRSSSRPKAPQRQMITTTKLSLHGNSTLVTKSFDSAKQRVDASPSRVKLVYSSPSKAKSQVLRYQPTSQEEPKVIQKSVNILRPTKTDLGVDHSKLNFTKNKTSATEIVMKGSQRSLSKTDKSNSIFQDYNFEGDSHTDNQRSSHGIRSEKNYSSVHSLSEKSANLNSSIILDSKTRDIAFNNLSNQNSQTTLKKNMFQNPNKLSDIREESFTMNTHTTTLKDLDQPKETSPDTRLAKKAQVGSDMMGKSGKKNQSRAQSRERIYVKRITYVNGIKKIQMVLSHVSSPLKPQEQTNPVKSVQRKIEIVRSKSPIRKEPLTENPLLKKSSLRERIEELKKKGSAREHQLKNNKLNLLNESANTREKRKIRWMNYDTSNTDFVTTVDKFGNRLQRRQTDLVHRNVSPSQVLSRPIVQSNISTVVEKKSEPKKEPLAKTYSSRRDWKNYSYGVGDKLQDLVSQVQTSQKKIKLEDSDIDRSQLGNSIVRKAPEEKKMSIREPVKDKQTPFSRFSINNEFETTADLINYSRGSVPLQNIKFSNSALTTNQLKDYSSSKKIHNFEKTQWKNLEIPDKPGKASRPVESRKTNVREPENKESRFKPVIRFPKKTGINTSSIQKVPVQTIDPTTPRNLKPLVSINIKQLPGLKESHSTGRLQVSNHITHSKNRSIDISKSSLRGNSQLRKVIDPQGNVRYKFINRPNRNEIQIGNGTLNNYSSVQRHKPSSFTQSKYGFRNA